MFTKNEIDELKKLLPHNGIQEIKQRTKFARVTVVKFFEGKRVKYQIAIKIWKEAWQLVKETKQTMAKLKREADEILSQQYE